MGNSNTVPAKSGESVVDYLRRKFRTQTRKVDNLVAQELREEEAEEMNIEDPVEVESLVRLQSLDQALVLADIEDQELDQVQGQIVPRLPSGRPVPRDRPVPRARPGRQGQTFRAQEDQGSAPFRTRILLQESTPHGSRTYCQDVSIDDNDVVEERVHYEGTFVRRRNLGDVIVTDLGDDSNTAGHHGTPRANQRGSRADQDRVPVSQAQDRQQYQSRLSRLRQMTLNLFRGRRGRGGQTSQPMAIEEISQGDHISNAQITDYEENTEDKQENPVITEDKDETPRPETSDTTGRASRLSLKDKARPVNLGGATMINEGCRTQRSARTAGAIRKKSGDAAIQKGPDRGIVWPKKMEDLYSATDKAYYIEQFQRTELFRQRLAKKEQGSATWMKALSPFQIWVIEHVGTPKMNAILKPKSKARPNHSKAKVECWRADKAMPQRRHRMEE